MQNIHFETNLKRLFWDFFIRITQLDYAFLQRK